MVVPPWQSPTNTMTTKLQKVPQPSKPTWVSVQDVVLNSLRPSTQPSQLLPELSHFYQTHKHKESVLLMSLWFLLVCHALTQNNAESPVDIFLSTSQKRSKTHVLTKSLYIKTWFVCLNKFECLKNVLKHFKHQNMIHDVSLRSVSNSSSECLSERCSRYHH